MVKINTLGGAGTKNATVIMMREDKFVSQFYMASSITLIAGARSKIWLIGRGGSVRPLIGLYVVKSHFARAHHEVPVKEDCLNNHIPR